MWKRGAHRKTLEGLRRKRGILCVLPRMTAVPTCPERHCEMISAVKTKMKLPPPHSSVEFVTNCESVRELPAHA